MQSSPRGIPFVNHCEAVCVGILREADVGARRPNELTQIANIFR